jgi:VWFA-related protein
MWKFPVLVAVALIPQQFALAQVMRGKVTMPDGSPPPQRVIIERACPGGTLIQDALTGKHGEYFWRVPSGSLSGTSHGSRLQVEVQCVLRARLKDMESDGIDFQDPKVLRNLQLPTLVLHRVTAQSNSTKLPPKAAKPWELAVKAFRAEKWAEAERRAGEVAQQAPTFAPAWDALGLVRQIQQKAGAREAFLRAVAANPTALLLRLHLARAEITLQLWPEAAKSAEALIEADAGHRYPEAHLLQGIAKYMLHEMDKAQASFRTYLERVPNARNAAQIKAQIEEMSHPSAAPAPSISIREALLDPEPQPEPEFTVGGEAWVPGGRKALAAIARLNGVPRAEDVFLEYCRAVATQTSRMTAHPIPGYAASLQAYVGAVAELMDLGERKEDSIVLTLSLSGEKTRRILALLGWKVVGRNGAPAIEPGDQPADGPRQQIATTLGIDESAMREALEAGRTFRFEIVSESAALSGGASWSPLLQSFATLPGGIAEAFVRDVRLARTYAGLASMPATTASALVRQVGLRRLATNYSDALWRYGGTFRPPDGAAEVVWEQLAGVSPRDPARFFEALLKTDRGRLAGFYAAVARADPARQKFFLKNTARAQRLYAWYREAEESRGPLLQEFPLDEAGRVRFPGGPQAWSASPGSSDDEILWPPQTIGNARIIGAATLDLDALIAVVRMERERAGPLDTESARLLARNFGEWHALFPYFAELPRLGAAEFRALETFASAAQASAAQEAVVREWHSLVVLIVLARKAGSLDDEASARAFGRVCRDLTAPDHAAKAIAVLRDLAGGGADLDEAVVNSLLRLSGPGRAAFDRVRELQAAPRLGASADVGTALNGIVYGAMLDPDALLVNEDPGLLRRHTFVRQGALFSAAALNRSNMAPGSRFTGGFMKFNEAARGLTRGGGAPPAKVDGAQDASNTTFRTSARLVEVYATVTDRVGRPLDGFRREQFTILDGGQKMSVSAFENDTTALSCALLLDTSLSMEEAMPALKSAALKLIGGLRPDDTVAIFALNGGISELQPFTKDKSLAARVALHAELGELTALYDGLVRVNRDLAARAGKKAIVVFTDGEDNNSTLSAEIAILRAKTSGVPIYTIAQGHALAHASLLEELSGISQATGGLSFRIQSAGEIGPVFDLVLQNLLHGYLLAFYPPPVEKREWRKIEVRLRAPGSVRARQGYYPE